MGASFNLRGTEECVYEVEEEEDEEEQDQEQ